jgi:hypothetical protein
MRQYFFEGEKNGVPILSGAMASEVIPPDSSR